MLKKLIEMLSVQEADLQWVKPMLKTLIQGSIAAAVIFSAVTFGWLLVERQASAWMLLGPILLVVMLGLRRLNRLGHTSAAINLLLATITLYAALAEPLGLPVSRISQLMYALPIAIAALLLAPTASLVWAVVVAICMAISSFAGGEGLDYGDLFLSIVGLGVVTLLMWFFGRSFKQTYRTLRRQLRQGRASIEIGHTVTAALDPSLIIEQTVKLIHEAFGYYHVGLFVLNQEGSLAMLKDAAGEAAASLKEREFHTPLSGTTAVAAAIKQKQRQCIFSWQEELDDRGRTVQFTYDRLPTRAELVIPLLVRDQVLGALDIHSTELDPFSEEDIHTLEGLVGNVANALDVARLLDDVQKRHQELTAAHSQTERRSRYLETTAELARTISSLADPQELLERAVELISQGLDLYHAGIFLVEEGGEWAVLAAANSEGGRQMMARGHKLRVGEQGIVGWVTQSGQPRIALDVGGDAVYFDNPDLPETRSEIALPLEVSGRMIGALDVQSKREAAFSEEDIAVLQILADQVAIAIENARLFRETEQALQEVQATQRHYVAQEWERLSFQRTDLSAEYCSLGVPPLKMDWTPEMKLALTQKAPVVLPDLSNVDWEGDGKGYAEEDADSPPARAALAIPIKLRDEVIGVLDLQEAGESRDWSDEDISMATDVADQLALALENARLFEETRDRAQEMEGVNEVGRAITSMLDQREVIRQLVDITKRRFGYYFVSIALIEGDKLILRDSSTIGDSDARLEAGSLAVDLEQDTSLVTEAVRTAEPVLVNEVREDPRYMVIPELADTRSELDIPMIVKGRIIGVLNVQNDRPYTFSQTDVALLQSLSNQAGVAIDNARLFEETQRRMREVQLLNDVSLASASGVRLEETLQSAAEALAAEREADLAALMLLDEESDELSLDAGVGYPEGVVGHARIPVGEGVVGWVAEHREPVLVPDKREEPRSIDLEQVELVTRSELCVPMITGGRCIGVINVESRQINAFTEDDLRLLTTLAGNMAVLVERARLTEETRYRAQQLAAINEVGQAMTSVLDPSAVLQQIVDSTKDRFGYYFVNVALVEGSRVALRAASAIGDSETRPESGEVSVDLYGLGLVSEAARTGEPTLSRDVREDQRYVFMPEMPETMSELCVPIKVRGRVIGVLDLESSRVNDFDDTDVALFQSLASQAGAVLENARLFEETRTRADELARLNELSEQLSQATSLEEYLNVAALKTSQLLQADRASVALLTADGDFDIYALHGEEGAVPEGIRISGEGRAIGRAVDERRVIIVPDDRSPDMPEIRSSMVAPLMTGGRVLGTLNVASNQPDAYTQSDGNLLTQIASHLSAAMENRRLFEDARIRAEELAVLNELAQALTAQLEVDQIVEEAHSGISRLLDSTDNFYLALYNPANDVVSFPLSTEGGERIRWEPRQAGEGMTEYVINSRQPLLIPENVDERLEELGIELIGQTALSWLGVPLIAGNRVLGAIAVQDYDTPQAYDEHDQDLLAATANQVAIALQNARLFEETATRAEELAVLNELAQALTAQLDVDQVLEETYQGTARLMDASNFYLALYDPEEDEVTFALDGTEGEVRQTYVTRKAGQGLTEYVIHSRQPLLISENVGQRLEELGIELIGQTALSWLGVPLMIGDRVLGVMAVQSYTTPRAYDEHDRDLLSAIANQTSVALQSARLFEETTTRAEELAVLNELAQALTAQLNVDQVLEETYRGTSRLVGTPNFYVGLYDPDREEITVPFNVTESEIEQQINVIPVDQGLTGYIIRNRESLLIRENYGERLEEMGIESLGEPAGSWLGVPLMLGDQVLGMMAVQDYQNTRAFDEHDRDMLIAVASQAAIALQNARLFEATNNQLAQLTALQETSRAVVSTLELDKLLTLITEQATALLQGDGGIINLVNWEKGEDKVVAASGSQAHAIGFSNSLEDALSGWVALHNQPVISNQLKDDSRASPDYRSGESQNAILAPLTVKDQVVGSLVVMNKQEKKEFDQADLDLLTALANQAAIALQNARLFEETTTRAGELAVLNELAQALTAQLDVDQVLEEAYRGASRLLDTTNFFIGLHDRDRDVIDFAFQVTESEIDEEELTTVPADRGLSGYIIRNRESVLIRRDVLKWQKKHGIKAVGEPAASWLGVPLIVGDQVLGVMAIQSFTTPDLFDEQDRDLLTSIANQTAIALQSARLFEETQRRASQLTAAAEVARDATAILEVERLLDETVHLISEQFDFYHAGVFLVDEQKEYAVLQAASSEGGKRMLERKHRLKVGEVGIVGYVASTGEPRIALDVGADAMHFVNPDLPDTRSEMGLPLKARERVIGVLDVQSTKQAAFTEDDVAVLQTLADQLATAIANANLFQRVRDDATRRALINEVNQAAASSLKVEELLQQAGGAISRQLRMPSAIFEWDSDTETLTPMTIHDPDGIDVTPSESLTITAEMNPTMFQALSTLQLQVLFDVKANVHDAAAQLAQQLDLLDAAYVPLTSRGKILGLLELGRHTGHPVLDEGELSFLEVVATNLGVALENARLYQEAVETAERLAEVDRLKTQFLANMSHELRTPLNSIIGFSRVILKEIDGPLTEMQRTDLETVYQSGQHLLGLINDILEVSKIAAGKMELAFEEVDINEIIDGVMSTAVALVKDKPIELQQSAPDDLPAVRADARRIRQTLLNLVGNAAKFTEEGFIRVEAEANDTEVTISVVDSGIGIEQEKVDGIFEAFTQVDASTTRRAGGTGLGLSICKSYVELHGGSIGVRSTLGEGSTFYFTLPIEGPAAEEPEQEQERAREEGIIMPEEEISVEEGGKLVLCVEDDEGVITLFRRYLGKKGYQVVGLTDPTRVVDEARRLKPYAITLDVMMPEKDGWEVIQDLKEDAETSHIPVIMCTIVAEKGRGLSLGAADYLVKPILEQDLLAALDRLDREAGRHLVLVVDDQEQHRALLRRMIENQDGYEVVEAAGGQEAVTMLQQIQPQIIMLDLMMPDMDGFAVLEEVKSNEKTRSIPIIIVTAKELTEEDRRQLNSNAEALIQKGVLEEEELLEDVAAALSRLGRRLPQEAVEDHA